MNADKVVYSRLFLNAEPEKNNLTVVFRRALLEKGVNEIQLNHLVAEYITKNHGNDPERDRATHASNINKELASEHMSWNVFVKGMKILGVNDITILV